MTRFPPSGAARSRCANRESGAAAKASCVRRAIEEAGLALGRDVSLITHDDDLGYLKNGGTVPMFTATRSWNARILGLSERMSCSSRRGSGAALIPGLFGDGV